MLKRLTFAVLGGVALALMLGGTLLADEPRRGPKDRPDGPPRADGPRHPGQPHPGQSHPGQPQPLRRGPGEMQPTGPPHQPGPPDGRRGPRDDRPGPPDGRPGPRDGHPGPPDGRPADPDGPPRWPHHDWEAIEREDPEMFKLLKADNDLERDTRELAIQFRVAPTEERDTIRKRVDELVNKHFEVRQERRELELKRLKEELERLSGAIKQRNEARDALVKKRIAQLLGEDDVDF